MKNIFSIILLFTSGLVWSQPVEEKPKLVVGIVVDQMRQEYLSRFYSKFSERGFKRLMSEGFMLRNAHYNYVPTFTGPGHASVYSGTTPAIHGIIGNDFYDKVNKKMVNCVEDSRFTIVGTKEGNGDVSPSRMLSTTITDELRLFSQKRSKVIGVSLKDRGAVLPAGHLANAAYWFDGKSGKFISSTFYMSKLPAWVEKFNQLGLPDKYLSQEWKTLLPIEQYTESGPDESSYEIKLNGKEKAVFPYKLSELRKKNDFELITSTPFGNDLLTDLVKATIDGEQLGNKEWTDFMTVSFSSTDIIGHGTGPNAVEIEDVYLRLDRNIEDLLKTLDQKTGVGNYTVFLTADHAVAEVPQYLRDNRIPSGYFSLSDLQISLNTYLQKYFPGKEIIANISNNQVFLNQNAFGGDPKTSGVDLLITTELVANYLMAQEGIASVYTENLIRQTSFSEGGIKGMVARGYNARRSGDIAYVYEPGWIESNKIQGSTHGSPYSYDTNVPVLFYGFGIRKGSSLQYHSITDIAPTLSILLKIKFPNGCTGQPIEEVLK